MLVKPRCALNLYCPYKGARKDLDQVSTGYLTSVSKCTKNSFNKYKIKIANDRKAVLVFLKQYTKEWHLGLCDIY